MAREHIKLLGRIFLSLTWKSFIDLCVCYKVRNGKDHSSEMGWPSHLTKKGWARNPWWESGHRSPLLRLVFPCASIPSLLSWTDQATMMETLQRALIQVLRRVPRLTPGFTMYCPFGLGKISSNPSDAHLQSISQHSYFRTAAASPHWLPRHASQGRRSGTYWTHSFARPLFWYSTIQRISWSFSSRSWKLRERVSAARHQDVK